MLIYAVFFGVLGLVIGSFLNVVIGRVPEGQSIVTPRSHCPKCERYLTPLDLIPVISYFVLKGRCRYCQERISPRYPLVESLTGILFFGVVYLNKDFIISEIIFDLLFVSLLITLSFIDLDTFRLPDVLVLSTLGVGLIKVLVTGQPDLWASLAGGLGAFAIFYLIALFYPKGMGMGDVKFVGVLGIYLGTPEIFLAVFTASLMGVGAGIMNIIFFNKSAKDPIPFGPFLALGALFMLFFAPVFTEWIL